MNTKRIKSLIFILSAMTLSASAAYAAEAGNSSEGQFIRTAATTATTPPDFTKAAESTINCVVCIKTYATPKQSRMSDFSDPFFEFFFGKNYGNRQQQQQESKPQQLGLGSGVIISADGYIVTNNHVVDGAEKLEVTLNDNNVYEATVIGTDANTDLALLKIDADNLSFITFGDSDKLSVGEWVLAVGNPFGLTSTVTAGIVSAKARAVSTITHNRQMGIESFIQTDAVVNQGNSGGALVNTKGELVGINTMIFTRTGDYSGYAFAIPTTIVKKVISDLREYGTVQRAMLGIYFAELTPELREEKKIEGLTEGIYVTEIIENGAAEEAGIEAGDVITEINGTKVRNSAELQESISQFSPGDKADIKFYRNGAEKTVSVTFRNTKGGTKINDGNDFTELGCAFTKVPQKTKESLRIKSGVKVAGLSDGKFKSAGVPNGMIIIEINETPVNSQDDVEAVYNKIMAESDPYKVMVLKGFLPSGKRAIIPVPLYDEE